MIENKVNVSPLIKQYKDIKSQYPNTLLLFQVGDFYELFFEDAKIAAQFLGITLTKRGTDANGDPIPLAGVPVHVLDHYLAKLVKGGFKIAICDQLENSQGAKGARPAVIRRVVTQVLTPGTLTDSKLLDDKSASYLCVFFPTTNSWALLFVELLTGQLFITKIENQDTMLLQAELSRFFPDEIILPEIKLAKNQAKFLQENGYCITWQDFYDNNNNFEQTKNWFSKQFENGAGHAKKIFFEGESGAADSIVSALCILYDFLKRNNERALLELNQLYFYKSDDFLILDWSTQRNLELVKNTQDGSTKNTLFLVLDKAATMMGSRMLKKWLLRPLVDLNSIEQRLDAVQLIKENISLKDELYHHLKKISDLERVIGRIGLKRAQKQDYIALLGALEIVPEVKNLVSGQKLEGQNNKQAALLNILSSRIADFHDLKDLLLSALEADLSTDYLVKFGYNQELDNLRKLLDVGAQAIIDLEKKEQSLTNIGSLKIRYNGVYGYSIEITKSNLHLAPERYIRLQTLVNRERFTTDELKNLEYDINRANTQIQELEKEIFENIKLKVDQYLPQLRKLAQSIAYLDAILALAQTAYSNSYVRPTFSKDRNIIIKSGRHPVIEQRLQEKFIPNDIELTDQQSLWIITGPNMGGKSTYLRQIALMVIMAQIGSFVPADSAQLFIVDRIFTRIGAADNVAQGKSTFLVEMEETALICNNATANSLVILDEVGRGTSTYDGLAIAQSVIEFIYTEIKARCLFATHYHELTLLTNKFAGIVSYHAASAKTQDGIILLHKILPGTAHGSFGLEVAKLAQIPKPIINRAEEIIKSFSFTSAQDSKILT